MSGPETILATTPFGDFEIDSRIEVSAGKTPEIIATQSVRGHGEIGTLGLGVSPGPQHSFSLAPDSPTINVLCGATGAEFVIEATPGEKGMCQGCGWGIEISAVPESPDKPETGRVVERSPAELAVLEVAAEAEARILDSVPPITHDDPPSEADQAAETIEQIRAIDEAGLPQFHDPKLDEAARQAAPKWAPVPRTLIGGLAIPTAWVRSCADPACEICDGDGFTGLESNPRFCRCAKTRAANRIELLKRQSAQPYDPPKEIPLSQTEAMRRKRQVEGLARQVEEAAGDLAARDSAHESALSAVTLQTAMSLNEKNEAARKAATAAQDAASDVTRTRAWTKQIRDELIEAEMHLAELRASLAGSETREREAIEAGRVASELAVETGEAMLKIKTFAETEQARLRREHERRTAGARAELTKLRRRLAIAEARR